MRPSLTEVYAAFARELARRSTCPRLAVGAVAISDDLQILASGYNGAARGMPQCDQVGCLMVDGHCQRSVHAEMNVLLQGARRGTALRGASILTTHRPCIHCMKAIIQVGVVQVYYMSPYDSDALLDEVLEMARAAKVTMTPLEAK